MPSHQFDIKFLRYVLALLFIIGGFIPTITYFYIAHSTAPYIFEAGSDLPNAETALVLGTSKYLRNGKPNDFFKYRMEAAHDLYAGDKVNEILLSGDHHSKRYNEPQSMKVSLKERGIPEEVILLDPAGFRTFDSVIRAKELLGNRKIVIVSQQFHVERALFIARAKGMQAYGFIAYDSNDPVSNVTVKIREAYARVLTLLDLYLLETEPQIKPIPNQLLSAS